MESVVYKYISVNEKPEGTSDSFKWDDSATRLLLNLYKKTSEYLGKTADLQTKQQMWVYITEELNKYGYNLAPIQARNRFITLERAYKRRSKSAPKNGNSKRISVYDEEIQAILGLRRKRTNNILSSDNETSTEADTFQSFSENYTTPTFPNEFIELNKWDYETTQLLLNVYNEFATKRKFKTNLSMWAAVVQKINEHGHNYTVKQAQNRLGTLQRAYKKIALKKKNSSTKTYFPFEKEIREIMKKKSSFILEKLDCSDERNDISFENRNIDNVVIPSKVEPTFFGLPADVPMNFPNDENESDLIREIRLLRQEEEQFRNDVCRMHEEKLILLQENNDLLRTLIQKISKE